MRLKICLPLIAFLPVSASSFSRLSDISRWQGHAEEPDNLYGMTLPDGGTKASSFTIAGCKQQ